MAICRLYPPAEPLDPELVAGFATLPAALISDQMSRSGGPRGIRPVTSIGDRIVVGRALTARTQPGDNLIAHQAAEFVEPGDFVVIDAGGDPHRAIIGELWCGYTMSRGAVAVAVDGAARDVAALDRLGLPVFASAVTHLGPYKTGSGEVRGPVAMGGVVVHNGDYVIGDADGIVVVPRALAATVLAAARRRQDAEDGMLADIATHRLDRSWLAAALTLLPSEDADAAGVARG
jgi:regulator of RNase E activity RraA